MPRRDPPAFALEQSVLAAAWAGRRTPGGREMARRLGTNHVRWQRAMQLKVRLSAAEIETAKRILGI